MARPRLPFSSIVAAALVLTVAGGLRLPAAQAPSDAPKQRALDSTWWPLAPVNAAPEPPPQDQPPLSRQPARPDAGRSQLTQPEAVQPGEPEPIPRSPFAEPIQTMPVRRPAPLPGADLGLESPAAGVGKPAPQRLPGLDDSLENIVDTIRAASSTDQLQQLATALADMIIRQQDAARRAGTPLPMSRLLEGLSLAFNLRMAGAMARDDLAGQQLALEDYLLQLTDIDGRVKSLAQAGVPGGEADNVHLVGLQRAKVAAAVARRQDNRPSEVAALERAVAQARALRDARQQAYEAGAANLASLAEASISAYEAESTLIARTASDPAEARKARIAALQRHLADMQKTYDLAREHHAARGAAGESRTLVLVGVLLQKFTAALARLQGDTEAEIAALRIAQHGARQHCQRMILEHGTGLAVPAEVAEASKLLAQLQILTALSAASDPADADRERRVAYQAHRDRLDSLLQTVRARTSTGGGNDLAYAAARYLWVRLQLAALDRPAAAPAPRPQPDLQPAAGVRQTPQSPARSVALPPCLPVPPPCWDPCWP